MKRRPVRFISTFLMLTLLTSISFGAQAYANSGRNPAGNNGFVQVNRDTMADGIPQNEPHVSCTFYLEFYNYDQDNNYANVNFELQAPTNNTVDTLAVMGGNIHPFIGQNPAGGSNDLDAREAYTLNFSGTPQAQQGYHVKLTVDAPGSKGSDVKHKVFWVQPCEQTSSTASSGPSGQVLGGTMLTSIISTTPSASAKNVTALPNTGASLGSTLVIGGIATAFSYALFLLHQKHFAITRE